MESTSTVVRRAPVGRVTGWFVNTCNCCADAASGVRKARPEGGRHSAAHRSGCLEEAVCVGVAGRRRAGLARIGRLAVVLVIGVLKREVTRVSSSPEGFRPVGRTDGARALDAAVHHGHLDVVLHVLHARGWKAAISGCSTKRSKGSLGNWGALLTGGALKKLWMLTCLALGLTPAPPLPAPAGDNGKGELSA